MSLEPKSRGLFGSHCDAGPQWRWPNATVTFPHRCKPEAGKRYRAEMQGVSHILRADIGRVMSRQVEQGKAAQLVVERLGFRHSDLSGGQSVTLHKTVQLLPLGR